MDCPVRAGAIAEASFSRSGGLLLSSRRPGPSFLGRIPVFLLQATHLIAIRCSLPSSLAMLLDTNILSALSA